MPMDPQVWAVSAPLADTMWSQITPTTTPSFLAYNWTDHVSWKEYIVTLGTHNNNIKITYEKNAKWLPVLGRSWSMICHNVPP